MAIIDAFFSTPRPYKRVISVCIDIIFIQIAFWGAFWTRLGDFDQTRSIDYWYLVSFLSVITITCFIRIGFYRAILRYLSVHAIFTLAIGSLVSTVVFVLATYFWGIWVPRTVAIIYLAYLFILTGGARLSYSSVFCSA